MPSVPFLTPALIEVIQRGDAILFLGAGASRGARGLRGEEPLSGEQLRDHLCDVFLGGALKTLPLSQVAELAKNEAGLARVQQAIRELFYPLLPAAFHLLIPTFRWFAIITTNYDLVLERAYDQCVGKEQSLAPIYRDGEDFSHKLRDPSQVLYLKLHGCITRIDDAGLPLILASEEYAKHRNNRVRLFKHFADWARERTVVFCGYNVGDPNIQQVLFDLADMGLSRPPYVLVSRGLDTISERYWASKRFVVYTKAFEEFVTELDSVVPRGSRTLAALITPGDTSIRPWIRSHVAPSPGLLTYLQNELIHVRKGMPVVGADPKAFYGGQTVDWGVFAQDLDVRRRLSDDLILDVFLDKSRAKVAQTYLVKGYAGSGKSVALRRAAWDIATEYDGLVFFLREGGLLRPERLGELHSLTQERLYIVIDEAISLVADIKDLATWSERNRVPVTLIVGARSNEWNTYGSQLEDSISNEYELRDLTEKEIRDLISKLKKYGALGRLASRSEGDQVQHFRLTADRQLLVALHAVVSDKPFEEIVLDEYRNIRPTAAQVLYLDICTLNQLGAGVRAGLISRISGITFADFERDFFRPLEHVVHAYFDHGSRDNMYRARHRDIAEIVFQKALSDQAARANQITRIMKAMDVDYEADRLAFNKLIRGRALAELFSNKAYALQIFDAARESGASIGFIEHQRAVFELQHAQSDPKAALEAIERAEAATDHPDRSITHTKAAILRNLALAAPQALARQKLRDDARELLRKQSQTTRVSHPIHTLGQLVLDELREALGTPTRTGDQKGLEQQQNAIAELVKEAEQTVFQGLQRFPEDQFLLTLEAELARLLQDESRAVDALGRAFERSPGSAFVATRLARYEAAQGDCSAAMATLQRSLEANPANKAVHLGLAKLMMEEDESALKDDIAYQLRLSFSPGDANLDAQFWYARHCVLYGDASIGHALFRELGRAETLSEARNTIKGIVLDQERIPRRFYGSVVNVHDTFCFIKCSEIKGEAFARSSEFRDEQWTRGVRGCPVSFHLAFTFKGPVALGVQTTQ